MTILNGQDGEFEVIGAMRQIRQLDPLEDDNFAINKAALFEEEVSGIKTAIYGIGVFLTGLALLVGGIGVMNIMFVSVTERTREIGIRKAIGATKKIILSQFLYEASVICLVGGLIGVLLSFGVALLIDKFLMPATLSLQIILVSLTVSIMVGVVSGFVPALKASKLNPIDALHYE